MKISNSTPMPSAAPTPPPKRQEPGGEAVSSPVVRQAPTVPEVPALDALSMTPASVESSPVVNDAGLTVNAKKSRESTQAKGVQADKLLKQVEQAVERVKEAVKLRQSSLEFQVQEPHDTLVVTVRDKETQKVVRQIPSEEMLRIAQAIEEGLSPEREGLLMRDQA